MIEDNYYRSVGKTELERLLAAGHGPRAAQTPPRPLLRLLLAGKPRRLQPGDRRPLLGDRPLGRPGDKRGLRVAQRLPRSPAERAGIELGDTIVSVDGESIAGVGSTEATAKIKGPEGTEVTVGVLDAKTGKVREPDA